MAEAWFAVVHRLSGIEAHHKSWQVVGVGTEMGLVALLVVALRRRGRDPRWVALYALSPFPVVEVVANGHVDGLAALFLVAALVAVVPAGASSGAQAEESTAATSGRRAGRLGRAGALVGAATLVKLYPAVALVGLVGAAGRGTRRLPSLVRAGIGFAVVVVAGYVPHVLAVGSRVLGYLPGYLRGGALRRGEPLPAHRPGGAVGDRGPARQPWWSGRPSSAG